MDHEECFESEFYTGIVYGVAATVIAILVLLFLVTRDYFQLSQGLAGLSEGALMVIGAVWGSGAMLSLRVRKGGRIWFIGGVIAGTIIVVVVAALILAILASASSEKENNAG
ncbi:hypothetical protein IMZ38_01645 [Thermosphaera chiliense]|uniref:Uncharacterized protein n=1 Tax=Thermosphaera chiliense TaxID=3402707 RepID=A0A7M1UQY8_9CREN|nr:hypothetical protein [Thermosphaera aggregans]QOR94665.1 hypothetical protein IMZ38_01645 [Thermosphaera aggregans]